MQGFLLQPWTTVHCTAGTGLVFTFTQDEEEWLDLSSYADAAFWVDVSDVVLPSGLSPTPQITLTLQTSPSRDEAYFQPIAGPIILGSGSPSNKPILVKSVRGTSTVPMARWVRWQLSVPSNSSGSWGLTLRIRAVPSKQSFFAPAQLPGCVLWLRADLGVTLDTVGTGNVQQWNDQGPTGDSNKNLMQAVAADRPLYKPSDPNYNNQATFTLTHSPGLNMTSAIWATNVVQPNTWVFVAHNTGSHANSEYLMDGNDINHAQSSGLATTPAASIFAGTQFVLYNTAWSSPSVMLGEWNGSSSNIFFNNLTGAAQASGTVGTGASTSQDSMTFASQFGGVNYWDGSVAEIIGFSGILSAAQKLQLRQYLNGRYAFSLT
jgi:hypothetical protein